jgi:hypothetical protein
MPNIKRGTSMAKAGKSAAKVSVKRQAAKPPAMLTIRRAGDMTPEGRKAIANWLRMHANDLLKEGSNYAPVFRGRYMVGDVDA